jgi:hypothetical protein
MRLNLVFIFGYLFVVACNNNEETKKTPDLMGDWVNEQQDTLSFTSDRLLNYKPHIATAIPFFYSYEITEDTITLWLTHSSNTKDITNYYFRYSDKQIEIHDFQYRECDFYKRVNKL